MSYSLRALLQLIVTLFVAHIHAAALLEYNSITTNLNVSSNPHCYGDEHSAWQPVTLDCLEARNYIPKRREVGIFHQNGAADGFQLPLIISTRTCSIIINLESNIPEFSTWRTVSFATTTLIAGEGSGCQNGRVFARRTGAADHNKFAKDSAWGSGTR